MAIEHFATKDNMEKNAFPSPLKIDFCMADAKLLATLKGVNASEQDSKVLPPMTIEPELPIPKFNQSNTEFPEPIGKDEKYRKTNSSVKSREKHHVVVPHASHEVVPADPNAPAIEIIPYRHKEN